MKSKLFISLFVGTILLGGNIFATAKPLLTLQQAEQVALSKVNGEIEKEDAVEKHNKTIFSFFIKRSGDVVTHILVNEKGKIVRIADETPEMAKVK